MCSITAQECLSLASKEFPAKKCSFSGHKLKRYILPRPLKMLVNFIGVAVYYMSVPDHNNA